jgi:hypothetical protein
MADKVMIAVRFTEDVEFNKGDVRQYSDTLYYTQAEYDALKERDVEMEKQRRITNWKNIVNNPPAYVEPTKEQYEEELARQEEQITALKTTMEAKGYLTAEDSLIEEK